MEDISQSLWLEFGNMLYKPCKDEFCGVEKKKLGWMWLTLYPSAPFLFTHQDPFSYSPRPILSSHQYPFPLLTWVPELVRSSSDQSRERENRWQRRRCRMGSSRFTRKVSTAWSCHTSAYNSRVIFRVFFIAWCCMTTRRDCTFRDTTVTIWYRQGKGTIWL